MPVIHYADRISNDVGLKQTAFAHYSLAVSNAISDQGPQIQSTIKRRRKRTNSDQLKVLNAMFARTSYPTKEEREDLGAQLGMTPRSVRIW